MDRLIQQGIIIVLSVELHHVATLWNRRRQGWLLLYHELYFLTHCDSPSRRHREKESVAIIVVDGTARSEGIVVEFVKNHFLFVCHVVTAVLLVRPSRSGLVWLRRKTRSTGCLHLQAFLVSGHKEFGREVTH